MILCWSVHRRHSTRNYPQGWYVTIVGDRTNVHKLMASLFDTTKLWKTTCSFPSKRLPEGEEKVEGKTLHSHFMFYIFTLTNILCYKDSEVCSYHLMFYLLLLLPLHFLTGVLQHAVQGDDLPLPLPLPFFGVIVRSLRW